MKTSFTIRTVVPAWVAEYQKLWLAPDVIAGLTAASVVIPKAMAIAVIAGLPVEIGLYMALATLLVYPLFGTSRSLSVTSTSAIAILVAAQVSGSTALTTGMAPTMVAATLALLVGGMLTLGWVLRLGFLANFISLPVLVGFEAGLGVVIVVGQLGALLGVGAAHGGTLGTLAELPAMASQAHPLTVLISLTGIAGLLLLPRIMPKLPVSLLWAALSIATSVALGLGAMGVGLIGAVPAGLPRVAFPDISLVGVLWPAALGIAVMSFTESVAAAQSFRSEGDRPIVANRELLAIGMANLAAAFVSGMPAGGGTSQTAVVDKAGAKSPLAQWVNAAAVALVLVFLSTWIAAMPKAALGALALVAALSMIKPEKFRDIGRVRRLELLWALVAFAGVILFGTLQGILIAVVLSILTLIYKANHPAVYALGYNPERKVFGRVGDDPCAIDFPGLLILRTEGSLTFANAAQTREKLHDLVVEAKPKVVVLECSAIPDIEYTALIMLTEAEATQRKRGVTLWLAGVNADLQKVLDRTPLGAALGSTRIHPNLFAALAAWQAGPLHLVDKAGS